VEVKRPIFPKPVPSSRGKAEKHLRAFKVGENYYVEDGHNRVSVARALGMLSIRAEVWEYPIRQAPPDGPVCCPAIGDLPRAGWPEE
jgi:hypothetical protein